MDERMYWLGFSAFSGIGPVKFGLLLNSFGSAEESWNAPTDSLKKVIGEKTAEQFEAFRKTFSIEEYYQRLKIKHVEFVTLQEPEYPELLKQIQKPPFIIYVKGNIGLLSSRANEESVAISNLEIASPRTVRYVASSLASSAGPRNDRVIAIVGTRKVTSYGAEVTQLFARELTHAGFTIVSGLALGVDAIAHATTVGARGKTIAILGCGVDCCNPRENQNLYNKIVESGGVIVSEVSLSQSPTKGTFPSRNRIIAGMSQAVIVTEGAEDSGSLITAEMALKEGRPVFAVPGPITSSLSRGPYKLISQGAKLVTKPEDVMKSLGTTSSTSTTGITGKEKLKGETEEENKILELLENEALHFDELSRKTGFEPTKLGSVLSLMEIKGMIKNINSGMYSM